MRFDNWCFFSDKEIGDHSLRLISSDENKQKSAVTEVAKIIPTHYASEERIAQIFQRLGKSSAARFIENSLPTEKPIRSGDLGEIIATEWINFDSHYDVPIKRLRWKDHRNMAMRGEDVIGFFNDPRSGDLQFLKTEAKSRAKLNTKVITEARKGLDKDNGFPSAHALSFIANRLSDLGNDELADAIHEAQLKKGIQSANVRHLLFTFSGNAPEDYLANSLEEYTGNFKQWGVGIQINQHQAFIAEVYETVIANANN